MSIVRIKNKKTGITYAFDSVSYWDKEKKQPRNKRTLIGRVDPETGEIVPTRKRMPNGSKKGESDDQLAEMSKRCKEYEITITRLNDEIARLKKTNESLLSDIRALAEKYENKK